MKHNKKGDIGNIIFFIIIIFVIATVSIIMLKFMGTINTNFQSGDLISAQGKSIMSSINGRYAGFLDNSFIIIFVGVIIGMAAGAWFIYTHPALFWVSIPIFAFIILFAGIFGNAFYNISNSENLSGQIGLLPITQFIMNHFIFMITIVVLIISFTLFAKSKQSQEQL